MIKGESEPIPWQKIWEEVGNGRKENILPIPSGYFIRYEIRVFEKEKRRYLKIRVEDVFDNDFYMAANVAISDGSLTLNMNTRGYKDDPEGRHPAMYASRFVPQVLDFFHSRYIAPTRFIGT